MASRRTSVRGKDGSSVTTPAAATQLKADLDNVPSASVPLSKRVSKRLLAIPKTSPVLKSTLDTSASASPSSTPITPRYPRRTRVTSTTIPTPPSSVPYFFTWNPTSLVDEANVKGSVSSRRPRFYDMHLHEDLTLKKVVLVPDMASQIAKVADTSLKKHYDVFLRGAAAQPTKMTLSNVKIRHTQSESEVRSFYQDDIAPACRKMASMLGLGINNETVFGWSTDRPEQKRAMADGFLSLKAGPTTLNKDLRAHIDVILYWKLDILVLWEFKSLAAGCRGVMMAIRQLATDNSFVWTACTPSCHCNSKKFHPHDNPRFVRTGRKTGPDARSPPWTFISPREKKRSFDDMCKLDDGGDYISEGEDDLPDGDPTEEEYSVPDSVKETNITKAHDILQQGWAEAVQSDATFFVINAGQYEYLCIRYREEQTLYVSDPIKICESVPAYGKLHTGLYIAAFEDALDRAEQLRKIQDSPTLVFDRLYSRKYPYDRVQYNHVFQLDIASHDEEMVDQAKDQELLFKISQTLEQNLEIRIQSDVQDVLDQACQMQIQRFRRLNSEGVPFDGPDGPHTFLLRLQSLTDRVFDCTAVTPDKTYSKEFVLKVAERKSDQVKLRDEYMRYLWLKEEGFTNAVEMFGLFGCEVDGMLKLGLLLSYGGVSLFHSASMITKIKLARLQPQAEKILKDLKRHGIMHHGLLLQHFLVSSADRLSLISWAHADHHFGSFEEGVSMDEDDSLERLDLTEAETDTMTDLMKQRRAKRRDELENEVMTRSIRKAFKLE